MIGRSSRALAHSAAVRSVVAKLTGAAPSGALRCVRQVRRVPAAHFARGTSVSLARHFSVASSAAHQQQAGQADAKAELQDVVYELSQADFQTKVMLSPVPVILDCYADWCGPCKQLTPVIEAEVRKHGGKVHLAKLDTDKNQQLAQSLRVQSLPTVLTIFKGRMTDSFVGAQQPKAVAEFVGRAAALAAANPEVEQTAETAVITATEALTTAEAEETTPEDRASALAAAKADFMSSLELNNLSKDASDGEKMTAAASYAGLLRVALHENDRETAKQFADVIRTAYPTYTNVPEVSRALSMFDLAAGSGGGGNLSELRAAVEANPADLDSRYVLAQELLSQGAHRAAIDECIEIVKRDRSWNEEAARKTLLKTFEVLGAAHDLTKYGRRLLAKHLF